MMGLKVHFSRRSMFISHGVILDNKSPLTLWKMVQNCAYSGVFQQNGNQAKCT